MAPLHPYRLPFAGLFRPHTAAELAAMTASIRASGVLVPVCTYDSPDGPAVLDGATRLTLALALDVPLPTVHLGPLSDDVARGLAVSLNTDRRQLTPEEQAAAREARKATARALVAAGATTREAAAIVGVSQMQVVRDIKQPSETQVSDVDPNERRLNSARAAVARLRQHLDALLGGPMGDALRRLLGRHGADVAALDAALADLAAVAAQGTN